MGLPPVAVGATQVTVALASPAVAATPVGAPGAMAVMATVCVAWAAAFQLASPAWLPVSVQVPAPSIVTVVPLTEHTSAVPPP